MTSQALPDWSALAGRCEEASGPDQALDWEIHCCNGLLGVGMYGDHPAYTSSLDAAMTLLPERRDWSVAWHTLSDGSKASVARVLLPGGVGLNTVADTPALALCAAAIRARASENNHVD